MSKAIQKRWRIFTAALLSVLLTAGVVRALTIDLDAWVQYSLLQPDGITPLADGSWVFIIGSDDNVIDPMEPFGDGYIADTVTGDDIILGWIRIDPSTYNNDDVEGTFLTTVKYDPTEVQNVYLRFFNTNLNTLTGLISYGYSEVMLLGSTLGVASMQFDQNGSLLADQEDTFVVIPEPTTGNLIVLVSGMIWAMRASMKRKGKKDEQEPDQA